MYEHGGQDYPLFTQKWVDKGGLTVEQDVSNTEFYAIEPYFREADSLGLNPGPVAVVHRSTRKPLTPWSAAEFIYNAAAKFATETPGLHWDVSQQPTVAPWQPADVFVPPV